MPIRKDDTGKRWVEMEFVVPGSAEQLWRAVATGNGYTAWFTKTEIQERVDGEIRFDFGPNGSSTGQVTIWEPFTRFGYIEREWNEDAPAVETEIAITRRPDGNNQVRMTHWLMTNHDKWDASLESFEAGWQGFFEVLRLYLLHFADSDAASTHVMATANSSPLAVWKSLLESLDLNSAHVGEQRITPSQPQRLSGVLERVHQSEKERYLLLRLDSPAPGVAMIGTYRMGDMVNASIVFYYYGEDACSAAAAANEVWTPWLERLFEFD